MKYILLLYFATISFGIKAQSYNSIVSDSIIHDFIKSVLFNNESYQSIFNKLPKNIYYKPIHIGKADWDMLNPKDTIFEIKFQDLHKFDSIFSKQDFEFIKNQYSSLKDTIWKLTFKQIKLKKKYRPKYFKYSIPLFAKDFKHAIFWRYYYRGPVSAYSELHIYKWENGKWLIEFIISGWMA